MSLAPYRSALARPGVPALLLIAVLARIPLTAAPVVLTLHVALDLHEGFAAAGALGAVFAVGAAVGSPLLGRGVDRVGLRPVLVATTLVEGAFWLAAPELGLTGLLVTGAVAGFLAIPIFSLTRQALSAMVPPHERRAAFSLDSMGVELSYAVGPAAGTAVLVALGATPTLLALAGLIVASGTALVVTDPPVHSDDARLPEHARTPRAAADGPRPRGWLTRPLGGLLVATFASTLVVAGTDTALSGVVAWMGRLDRLGVIFVVWCLASLVGGFVVGASARRASPLLLLLLLSVLAVPAVVAGSWWALALLIIPTGLFCAPLMSATADGLTRTVPPSVRGLALGLHASALTVGNAVGAPLAGLVVDHVDPRLSFAVLACAGVVLAGVARAVAGPAPRSAPTGEVAPVQADDPAARPQPTGDPAVVTATPR